MELKLPLSANLMLACGHRKIKVRFGMISADPLSVQRHACWERAKHFDCHLLFLDYIDECLVR